jgi:hypothetical protein
LKIFLSYAEEDREIAGVIVGQLTDDGHELFNWLDPAQRGKQIISNIQEGMSAASAYLALLSPSYRKSYMCTQELGIAVRREEAIQRVDPNASFIHVVVVAAVAPGEEGMLGNYDAIRMTSGDREPGLSELAARFRRAELHASSLATLPKDPPVAAGAYLGIASSVKGGEPKFRNRVDELRKVLNGLTNTAGSHFWYVVAPPQLGKTWFLQQVGGHDDLSRPVPWTVRLADLREPSSVGARSDVTALLGLLFGQTLLPGDEALRIAQGILANGPHLCLLDSAELLTRKTATDLRMCLGEIHRYVAEQDGRFAFIAASRRDDDWKGVARARFNPLPLTEFTTEVVQQALHDLADEMGKKSISAARMWEHAVRVHRVTEGLPALLVQCLQWVRDEQWLEMRRLEGQQHFERFATPYIQQYLLTPATLLPEGSQDDAKLAALIQAYRVLAPYRLFTQSHLQHYQENDSDFRAALGSAGWRLEDLWQGIKDTALLKRPLTDVWKEIHPPIRRLLYRYFYRTPEQRIEAQFEARKFVETWSDGLAGIEQAVGLVECLWHEAAALRMREPSVMEQRLTDSARALSRSLRASGVSLSELREYAGERMRNDGELEDAVGDGDGLLSRLVAMVQDPEGS